MRHTISISETMRMHPAVGTLHRVIEHDYTLPNGKVAPKGTYVIVPAVAFHNDSGNHFKSVGYLQFEF